MAAGTQHADMGGQQGNPGLMDRVEEMLRMASGMVMARSSAEYGTILFSSGDLETKLCNASRVAHDLMALSYI